MRQVGSCVVGLSPRLLIILYINFVHNCVASEWSYRDTKLVTISLRVVRIAVRLGDLMDMVVAIVAIIVRSYGYAESHVLGIMEICGSW